MNEVKKIKIIMVEDDPVWLKIMTGFLNTFPDLDLVGTATSKNEALQLIMDVTADIILMDINLSENKRDGITAALEILEQTKVRIIMLTSLEEEELITDSFAVGAIDYISKDNYMEIPASIRRLVRRLSPQEVLLKDYARLKKEEQLKELTIAEREVFNLIEKGYSLTQIEEMMFKSHNTLKTQVKQILHKLKVKNRAEAVKKASSKGVFGKYANEDGK